MDLLYIDYLFHGLAHKVPGQLRISRRLTRAAKFCVYPYMNAVIVTCLGPLDHWSQSNGECKKLWSLLSVTNVGLFSSSVLVLLFHCATYLILAVREPANKPA